VAPELRCPLLAFYGDRDEFVPLGDIRALEAALAATPHETEVVVFPDAGHAFANDTRPDKYRPEAAAVAWERMVAFLGAQLRR
jgi:carboxymethylenebutenolidase